MKTLVQITFDLGTSNRLAREGTLGETIQKAVEATQPEAIYFTAINGSRGAVMVVDLQDSSQLPKVAEPWFLALNAKVEAAPAFTPQDLQKAAGDIEAAVKRFG